MKKISDVEKGMRVLFEFLSGKEVLTRYFTKDSLLKLDKRIILERMIENTVEDIVTYQKIRHLMGAEMDEPLSQVEQERLKKVIFDVVS